VNEYVTVRPYQLIIETSASCQLQCIGCPFIAAEKPPRPKFMSLDLFKSIIDRIDWPVTVVPWMNGEPLLNPDFPRMLKYLVAAGHRAYITTNGMIWDDEVFQLITDENSVYQIIFSLDGLPSVFSRSIERCRPGSNRERILSNIEAFGRLKMEKGSNLDMAVKICRRGQDQGEIEHYIHHWLQRPYINYVCEGRMLTEDATKETRMFPCKYPDHMFMVIRSDGEMVPCAYNETVVNDNWFHMGSVANDKPLLEVYNNAKMTAFRLDQKAGRFCGPCITCGFAYTGHGFDGMLSFRDEKLRATYPNPIWFHSDYYNTFYSLKRKQAGPSWLDDKE